MADSQTAYKWYPILGKRHRECPNCGYYTLNFARIEEYVLKRRISWLPWPTRKEQVDEWKLDDWGH